MWILPSRGRPHSVQRLIDSRLDMSTPVWLRVDEDDPMLDGYLALKLPDFWILQAGTRKPLSGIYNEAYEIFRPYWWGFIADDVVPMTLGWDRRLIEAAGDSGMAIPSGSKSTGPCPHFVLGRALPEAMGWLSLPGLKRLYIDTVWHEIALALGVVRHVPEVTLLHHHFSNGMALYDNTYKKPDFENDRRIYQEWLDSRNAIIV